MLKNNLLSLLLCLVAASCTTQSDITIVSKPSLKEEVVQSGDLFGGSDTYLVVSEEWKILWSTNYPTFNETEYMFHIVPRPDWEFFGYLDYGNTVPPGYLKEITKDGKKVWEHPNQNRYQE